MLPGDTFLLPKPGQVEHLWIVLTHTNENDESICVNVTTRRIHTDDTLILQRGDHPFIKQESVVHYEDARYMNMVQVEALLDGHSELFVAERMASCTHVLLDRIKDGLLRSRRTPTGIKDACKRLWT